MYLRSMLWNMSKFISNLYFSISLFLLLALISILGTVIEQDQSLDYYKLHYPVDRPVMMLLTWKKILLFGLNHMYSTHWFLSLLFLFFLSLLICTLSTQLPILKYSKQWSFLYNKESLEKKNICYKLQSRSFIHLIYLLNINNYFVFHKGKGIYAYKGLLGRISPIFVHISIIITFIGFILRMTSGLVVQEVIASGELFHLQNMVTSGRLSAMPYNLVGNVHDFFVTFNEDKSIQQFFSNISLLDNKKNVIATKYIWVNSPMKFKGLTIYQTDWQINALRVQVGPDKFLEKKLKKINVDSSASDNSWACNLLLDKTCQVFIVIPNLCDSLLVYDKGGSLIASTIYGKWVIIYGVPVLFKDLVVSTGLQIKIDPGLLISYLGFFILMISIVASYMSYSQIWANQNINSINLSGITNRALLSFEDEINGMYKKMRCLLSFSNH